MTTLLVLALAGQDLLERAREAARPRAGVSANRLDLRVGPQVDRSTPLTPGTVGIELNFVPDIGCGRFDLDASFRSVFHKNMRDELVGGIVDYAMSELSSSAMVLACQMSPTVCDAMKHYRVTAQDFLEMQFNRCRSLEQIAGGTERQVRASAVKECLERRQAEGHTLDEAMRACRDAQELRGLRGQAVQEIDLVREVTEALGLSGEPADLVRQYLNAVTINASRFSGQVKVRPTDDRYQRKRGELAQALAEAAAAASRGRVPAETLARLSPPGLPPFTSDEIQRLAVMDPADRGLVIAMTAAAMSLAQVAREAGDVQAALEAAESMAMNPVVAGAIERESRRLTGEVRRLKEAFEVEAIVAQARLRADAAAAATVAERLRQNTAAWREGGREAAARSATREWSKACPASK